MRNDCLSLSHISTQCHIIIFWSESTIEQPVGRRGAPLEGAEVLVQQRSVNRGDEVPVVARHLRRGLHGEGRTAAHHCDVTSVTPMHCITVTTAKVAPTEEQHWLKSSVTCAGFSHHGPQGDARTGARRRTALSFRMRTACLWASSSSSQAVTTSTAVK